MTRPLKELNSSILSAAVHEVYEDVSLKALISNHDLKVYDLNRLPSLADLVLCVLKCILCLLSFGLLALKRLVLEGRCARPMSETIGEALKWFCPVMVAILRSNHPHSEMAL